MKLYRLTILAIIILLLSNTGASAEWLRSIVAGSSYLENPFHYNGSAPLFNHTIALQLGNNPANSNMTYNYSGNYSLLSQLSTGSLTDNSFQLGYSNHLDENRKLVLNLSSAVGMGLNSTEYTVYDNYSLGVAGAMNYSISETSIARMGTKALYKSFYNSSSLSYADMVAYLGYKTYFETETSLNAELNIGQKNYGVSLMRLAGKGQYESASGQSASQIVVNIKAAQSLAEKTGLSLLYSQSWNLSTNDQTRKAFNPELIFDKDIYDDPYSYQSKELTATLTQYFSNEYKAQLSAFYSDKVYSYSSDLSNSSSAAPRSDISSGFSISLQKKITEEFLFFNSAQINLGYQYMFNSSNSDMFRYKDNEIGLSARFNF